MKTNKMQKYFLTTFGCSFVGYLICKYSFLPTCKLIANFLHCDYAVIALWLYLIIFVMIGYVLKNVKTDITTETYYKHNFTPAKALILVAVLIFFHIQLINDTIKSDTEGKILNLYSNSIKSAEKSENNNIKEKKNETSIKAKTNNDIASDTDADGMRYRD